MIHKKKTNFLNTSQEPYCLVSKHLDVGFQTSAAPRFFNPLLGRFRYPNETLWLSRVWYTTWKNHFANTYNWVVSEICYQLLASKRTGSVLANFIGTLFWGQMLFTFNKTKLAFSCDKTWTAQRLLKVWCILPKTNVLHFLVCQLLGVFIRINRTVWAFSFFAFHFIDLHVLLLLLILWLKFESSNLFLVVNLSSTKQKFDN